jgi:mRNA interferase MazF
MRRGELWWAALPEPTGSKPGYRRPILSIQSDDVNRSRIQTGIVVVLTTNLRLAATPGNVLVIADDTGLPKDSVVNVSQIITGDQSFLTERVGQINDRILLLVEDGIRTVFAL